MEGCRDGWRMTGAGGGKGKGSGGRLKLISRPPQLSAVLGELRHAYMWLIELVVWVWQVRVYCVLVLVFNSVS